MQNCKLQIAGRVNQNEECLLPLVAFPSGEKLLCFLVPAWTLLQCTSSEMGLSGLSHVSKGSPLVRKAARVWTLSISPWPPPKLDLLFLPTGFPEAILWRNHLNGIASSPPLYDAGACGACGDFGLGGDCVVDDVDICTHTQMVAYDDPLTGQ